MLFSRAREDQHAHGLITGASSNACCNSSTVLRFSAFSTFGRLKGDIRNSVPLFVQNIFVTHLFLLLGSAFLGVLGVSTLSFSFLFSPPLKLRHLRIPRIE